MHMNIYVFLQNMNILCTFSSAGFLPGFFSGSGPVSDSVHILGFAGSMTGPVLITLY